MSRVTRVSSNNKPITNEIFASVSKETSLILVTRFLGNGLTNDEKYAKNMLVNF